MEYEFKQNFTDGSLVSSITVWHKFTPDEIAWLKNQGVSYETIQEYGKERLCEAVVRMPEISLFLLKTLNRLEQGVMETVSLYFRGKNFEEIKRQFDIIRYFLLRSPEDIVSEIIKDKENPR